MPKFIKTPEDRQHWAKAKSIAARQGKALKWPYVMGIFKRLKGVKVASEFNPYRDYMAKAAGGNPLIHGKPFNALAGQALGHGVDAAKALPGRAGGAVRNLLFGPQGAAAQQARSTTGKTMAGPLPRETVQMRSAPTTAAPAAAPAQVAEEGFGLSSKAKHRLAVGAGAAALGVGGYQGYKVLANNSWNRRPNPYLTEADYLSED